MNDLHFINPARTKAILIGVSEYEDEKFNNVKSAVQCVEDFADLLADNQILGLNKEKQIKILTGRLNRNKIIKELDKFVASENIDYLIFYWVGHGDVAKKNNDELTKEEFCFVTSDTSKSNFYETSIQWDIIKSKVEKGSGIQQRLYVVDACHAGAIANSLGKQDKRYYNPAFDFELTQGSALLASADRKHEAYFDDEAEHTYFSGALIDLLKNGIDEENIDGFELALLKEELNNVLQRIDTPQKFNIVCNPGKINNVLFFRNKKSLLTISREEKLRKVKEFKELVETVDFEKDKGLEKHIKAAFKDIRGKSEYADIATSLFKLLEVFNQKKAYYHKIMPIHKAEIATLNNTIKEHEAQNKQKDKELKDLTNHKKELTDREKTLSAEKKRLEAENSKFKKDLENLKRNKGKKDKKIRAVFLLNAAILILLIILWNHNLNNNDENYKAVVIESPKAVVKTFKKTKDYIEIVNEISFKMIKIKGGTFKMGTNDGDRYDRPIHSVTIGDFYMGEHEVTFAEYDSFCEATNRKKPSDEGWGRGNRPAINVSWNDATAYCKWLSKKTGKNYILPTEAEWEYAAGGGSNHQKWAGTNSENSLGNYAWYELNSGSKTHPVCSKRPNTFGLYDMSGNVIEWCSDRARTYSSSSQTNPQGASNIVRRRVFRGGSWDSSTYTCRVAIRSNNFPAHRFNDIGFRVVCR